MQLQNCAFKTHRLCQTAQRCARRSLARRAMVAKAAANDYKASVAAFFPGQGAQSVGMAKDLVAEYPAAKELFDKASEILGYDLLQVCVEGPKDKLNSTVVSQPAIYVSSLAAIEKLRATEGQAALDAVDVTCGLSLGEYTALAFAGAFSFEDGLRLVKLRGESMQAAADAKPSSMVSIIGLSSDKVAEMCAAITAEVGADKPVKIANFLCPGNYAVSGSVEGCDLVQAKAKPEFKARMAVRLAVAGAFHTEYMAPAVEKLQAALDSTLIVAPRIPVISNVTAEPHGDPASIKSLLAMQVTSPVLWENTISALVDRGLTKSYEIGPGKVIAGIVKRIKKDADIINVTA